VLGYFHQVPPGQTFSIPARVERAVRSKGPQEHVPTASAQRASTHAARTLFPRGQYQRLMRHLVFPQQLGTVFTQIGSVALARVRNITHHAFPGDPVEFVRVLEVVLDAEIKFSSFSPQ
jgi:hypothetical protein